MLEFYFLLWVILFYMPETSSAFISSLPIPSYECESVLLRWFLLQSRDFLWLFIVKHWLLFLVKKVFFFFFFGNTKMSDQDSQRKFITISKMKWNLKCKFITSFYNIFGDPGVSLHTICNPRFLLFLLNTNMYLQ